MGPTRSGNAPRNVTPGGITPRSIAAWCDPAITPTLQAGEATEAFHALSPKVRFIKTLPIEASVLDAGAGAGSVILFKDWPAPARTDLHMFAWAGERGDYFDRFEAAEVGWWPQDPPHFGGRQFHAIMSTNFIEHIDDPAVFIRHCADRLTPFGRIYLEWPRSESIDLPSTAALAAAGVTVMTGRYHDDATHRPVPPSLTEVTDALVRSGLRIVERGTARVPMVDQQLAIHARRDNDIVGMTLAYWSFTEWCQFVVAERGG
jgi:SAM-dependent methyltransferase